MEERAQSLINFWMNSCSYRELKKTLKTPEDFVKNLSEPVTAEAVGVYRKYLVDELRKKMFKRMLGEVGLIGFNLWYRNFVHVSNILTRTSIVYLPTSEEP